MASKKMQLVYPVTFNGKVRGETVQVTEKDLELYPDWFEEIPEKPKKAKAEAKSEDD
jgi:molybdopterin synthase catalytic subunit